MSMLERLKALAMPKGEEHEVVTLSSGEEEELELDPEKKLMQEHMGFSNFTAKWQTALDEKEEEVEMKEERPSFRCVVCDLELNSADTYASHIRGVRHVKNEKLQSAERGEILVVPPSTQTRVKVPVTLGEKIKECNEPLVGLADVREVLPISNREMEPHYYCDLCNQQGQANCMLLHLKGRVHRQAWVDKKYRGDPNMIELSQADLKAKAKEMDERKQEEERLRRGEESAIKTIYSDEAFPWPAGKAPWLKENGGTGSVPEGALERLELSRFRKISLADAEEEFKSVITTVAPALPPKGAIQAPRNVKEAKQMLELAKAMVEMVGASKKLDLKEMEVKLNKAGAAALNLKLGKEEEEHGSNPKRPRVWGSGGHLGSWRGY